MVEVVSGQIMMVVDEVSRMKNIERERVFIILEQAISKAGRAKYGHEYDIRAEIDRNNGHVVLKRFVEVLPDEDPVVEIDPDAPEGEEPTPFFESSLRQIRLADAKEQEESLDVGDYIVEELPPIDFGRIAAQSARQVILQGVRAAEKEREFDEYKDKVGQIVNGVVKRVEFGNIAIDLGRAEAVIRKEEAIPRENLRQGDRVRAYIYEVSESSSGPQIFLSRTHPQFVVELFKQEVQEVYDGVIEIKGVARDPGSRAKMAVVSHDPSIDPRGACIGMRGSRVQAVKAEIQEENIDVILWNPDPATFVVDALYPAEVTKVVLDEEANKIEVVVGEENLSLAIGRRGQNVRLAAKLTGWEIDIMTEAQEAEAMKSEIEERANTFMDKLDVDDVIARLLATEGFGTVRDVAFVPLEELTAIQGFDEDIASELQNRAVKAVEKDDKVMETELKKASVNDDLLEFDGITNEIALALAANDVKSLDDFADLGTDELLEYLPEETFTRDQAEAMIMAAREKAGWFADEPAAQPEEAEKKAS